jgi:YD repeat-containing protein
VQAVFNDVVGGKTIEYLTGSPLRQTSLPYLSPSQPSGFPQNWGATVPNAYRTCFTISMPGVTAQPCSSATSQNILLYSDQYYGHRITVFSTGSSCAPPSGSCVPQLLIDGQPPPDGQNTGTAANYGTLWQPISIDILHPYTCPSPPTQQCLAFLKAVNQSSQPSLTAGGSYLIGNGWGQVGRGMVEKHRTLLAQARAAGDPATSEAVLGESLAVISYSWLAEVASAQRLGDAVGQLTTQYHHGVGITAQTAIQQSGVQGPYVDLPMNFLTMQPQTSYTGSGIPPSVLGEFFTLSGVSSSLESAVLEQTQAQTPGMQAASTVRLVDINAATSAKTFFADGTTTTGVAAYFNNIDPNLTGSCSTFSTDRQTIRDEISSDGTSSGNPTGNQVLIPANLCIQVGSVPWTGAGFTITTQSTSSGGYSISATQKITGGLSGGYSGTDVSIPGLTVSTATEMQPAAGNPSIPAAAGALPFASGNPTSNEPVDTVTGAYLYRHTDLVTGSGAFPYALPFARNYSSASNLTDLGLGNGWANGYSIAAARSSDPYRGFGFAAPVGAPAAIAATADMGENAAINAAAAIAALYVSQDLMSGTENAKPMTVAWMVNRWLTDQLTNNAVMVSWPATSEEFTFLPHADNNASVTYSAPIGSAVVLTGSLPDSYGNYTSFAYTNKDRSQIDFTQLGSAANGQIASWSFPDGMNLSFTYGYTYNGTSYLTNVANPLGRSLTLAYSGAHLGTVTDDTGRQASYGYDGDNLASYIDPLSNPTTFGYDGAGHLLRIFYPTEPTVPFVTNTYDALGRVSQQANADGNSASFYLAGSRSELVDAAGDREITYQTPGGRVIKDAFVLSGSFGDVFNDTVQQNGIVDVAASQYDGLGRLILATAPEGGTTGYTWSSDLESNITQVTRTPKPGSPLSSLTTSYAYDPVYNRPTSITDPLGLVTTMAYATATGNLLSSIADAGGGHFNAA